MAPFSVNNIISIKEAPSVQPYDLTRTVIGRPFNVGLVPPSQPSIVRPSRDGTNVKPVSAAVLSLVPLARADELKVLCAGTMHFALKGVGENFTRETSTKLAITYGGAGKIRSDIGFTTAFLLPYDRLMISAKCGKGSGDCVVLAFDHYRLDIDRRELRRGTELIELEPRAFDLLAFLVRQRDRVVSKDDLLQAVWHGRIVSESALTTRINAVRRALGDDGTAQRLIRTFTRKGVRFVGEVTQVADRALSDKPSIAVLPFQNLSGDPEQDYFADGMVEEITTAIARSAWLFVIARNSSFALKGKSLDVKQAARELGVRYVLEGSVRRAGNRVRIAGQLIDSATGAHIWAERFDGTVDDIFEFQDLVASGVVGAIEPQLRVVEAERAVRKPTDSLDAYDLYWRAQAQAFKRTSEGLVESIRLARLALDLDPGYGPAMSRIALSRSMQRHRNWIPPAGPEVEEGIMMARRAIAAAGHDPWVLDFAGLALAQLAGDTDAALSALDRAMVLNPNFAIAFGHRALVLAYLNRPEEAILSGRQAMRLSPLDPVMFAFCQALALAELAAGRYEAGLSWAEQALRENSGMPAFRLKLSLCGHLGRVDDARASLSRAGEFQCEPTVAGIMRALPNGAAPELAARIIDGLRKAGIPEG